MVNRLTLDRLSREERSSCIQNRSEYVMVRPEMACERFRKLSGTATQINW